MNPPLDPTTAALAGAIIGAVVTLIAGTVAPLIRDVVDRRARSRSQLRTEQRGEIANVLDAYAQIVRHRQVAGRDPDFLKLATAAEVAATRLSLVSPKRDLKEIRGLLNWALEEAGNQNHSTMVHISLQILAIVLERWYRGELRGKAIGDAVPKLIDELTAPHIRK